MLTNHGSDWFRLDIGIMLTMELKEEKGSQVVDGT
jgi:hypothetical protein